MQRDFKRPEGVSEQDMDANAEGEVMAVLGLRADEGLRDAGLAREVVNRVQKLRKKAGLQARPAPGAPLCCVGSPASSHWTCSTAAYRRC